MIKTEKRVVIATLGQLVTEARQKGISPQIVDGHKQYQLVIEDGAVRIGRTRVENKEAAISLQQLAEAAKATGVKPKKDSKGNDYYTYAFDFEKGTVEVVTSSDEDIRRGKAITPKKG